MSETRSATPSLVEAGEKSCFGRQPGRGGGEAGGAELFAGSLEGHYSRGGKRQTGWS